MITGWMLVWPAAVAVGCTLIGVYELWSDPIWAGINLWASGALTIFWLHDLLDWMKAEEQKEPPP